MEIKEILFLDNASTTKINDEVLSAYKYLLDNYYFNSSAIYPLAKEIKNLQEKSRQEILSLLNIKNYKLIFTSSASEANNIAIKSLALKHYKEKKHAITTKIEHPSVYNTFKFLEEYLDFEVTYLDVDKNGQINLEDLKTSLRDDTLLVSIVNVNNEIGSVINTLEWCSVVKESSKAYTHSDMVQAIGNIELKFDNLDMASFSAHKINGVKGSGFLLMRDYLEVAPFISGGSQEYSLRAGTENSAANIVLAKTVRLALENQKINNKKIKELFEYTYKQLENIENINIHTPKDYCSKHIINFSPKGIGSEIMLNALSKKHIYVGAGSSCLASSYSESRVLKSLNVSAEDQRNRIRISFNKDIRLSDIDYFIKSLKEIIEKYAI